MVFVKDKNTITRVSEVRLLKDKNNTIRVTIETYVPQAVVEKKKYSR